MRRMPGVLRCVLLAIAMLQSWSGVALSVTEGLSRARDSALPAHVEDQNASHGARGHSHDCIACRGLRSGPALPGQQSARAFVEGSSAILAYAPVVLVAGSAHECCARAPPERVG